MNYGQPASGQDPPGPPGYGQYAPSGYGHTEYGQQGGYEQQQPIYPSQGGYGQQTGYNSGYAPAGYGGPAVPAVRSDYASWGKRVGAYIIDLIPSLIGQAVFFVGYFTWLINVVNQTNAGSSSADLSAGVAPMIIGGVLVLAALGWQIYNRWLVAGRTGQSMGKRMMKISLIGEQTERPIGPMNAFLRDLVHILDGFAYVGFLWPLWDERKQTFADKLMKTIVIDASAADRSSAPTS